MQVLLEQYLKNLTATSELGDAREESYYRHLDDLIQGYAEQRHLPQIEVTILPKQTEAGNPDFRIWDGKNHITGYIEAKAPLVTNLDPIENSEQVARYRTTFPNVILTNFYEFRLYRDGQCISATQIGRPVIAQRLHTTPPVENVLKFKELLDRFFAFSLPKIQTTRSLAVELAKRTRFLRDEIITVEMAAPGSLGHEPILGFYQAFQTYLMGTLTEKQFADLYAQTITYGLFAARTRADGEFNRQLAFYKIPNTIGILRDIFRFISLEEPPSALQIIVDDIAEILQVTDVNQILRADYQAGKGDDPIISFYEPFLETYDPEIRERRGVYYTPDAVVQYIVGAIHSLLKSHFDLADGLAAEKVQLLDPAAGTLTFLAAAIRLAAHEFTTKYGDGGLQHWIQKHILQNFYAFELMMAPYSIGHLKISFLFAELGYQMTEAERFQLYLTNTLEMEELQQIAIPGLSSLSRESHLAGKIKKDQPVLVILGNPPYSGISANTNAWTEQLLKSDLDGLQSFYKVDGQPLGEKNPKWLQDDYVKFLRFAQWKIQKSGAGIVGMITNHSYLDNPTFRGMRQSLMQTFDEIYILDLHGNSLKKETTPEGSKDENVFDIRQGVAIALFVKNTKPQASQVFHADLYGLRETKYEWLQQHAFSRENYTRIQPQSPDYFLVRRDTAKILPYLQWKKINEIFPLNGVGITTARDNFVIDFDKHALENRIRLFKNSKYNDADLHQFFQINQKQGWDIRKAWKMLQSIPDTDLAQYILPISYRPFDTRFIFWHDAVVWRTVKQVMRHLLEKNIGLVVGRQGQVVGTQHLWNLSFITENIIDFNLYYRGGGLLLPLYTYPDEKKSDLKPYSTMMMIFEPAGKYAARRPNIIELVYEKLSQSFPQRPTSEDILYYIYGIFYSEIYRQTYSEFLKMDFPRIPFTSNFESFTAMAKYGQELADLHLMQSPALNPPIAKYPGGSASDRIEKITYQADEQRVYINQEKYFEGITPAVWNYHIGGYQVLQKYLKDRKGR
ncbi:N-6 DNA methylase, partial [candidate division KSB1 bacterium]|nr:N-6 DNA methylase [candidate division KSB1 bacterium]